MLASQTVKCVRVTETETGREATFIPDPPLTLGHCQMTTLFLLRSGEPPVVGQRYVITLSEDLPRECAANAA